MNPESHEDVPPKSLVGHSVGRYEVLTLLGAGGMGEVYLAQDTSLGRKVALKLLPTIYTTNSDRLRRFEQEARTASALNHPNIVTIYEIGHTDSTHFIATEYLDGATLRTHLATTLVQTSEVLDIAVQVASALAAAHAKGVVHRDIKPENIMVLKENYSLHRENYVKVLDFGIAKLTEATTPDTEAPTKPLIDTNQGVVLGTASYMSPEQARGILVDARTDIWSLGVVLYEMLTGNLPFKGETAGDVRAAILKDKLPALSAEVPDRLKWIVEKALRKDREDRYQTAREFFSDLRELQKQEFASEALREHSSSPEASARGSVESGQAVVSSAPVPTGSTSQITAPPTSSADYIVGEIKRHKRGVVIALTVVIVVVGLAVLGLIKLLNRNQTISQKPLAQSMKITRLTDNGKATAAAISPDGNYVVYAREDEGKQSLWLKQVVMASEKEIVPSTDSKIVGLTFSRDGSLIYYTASPVNDQRGVLYQVPALGGTSRKMFENVFGPVGLSRDGKHLAFIRTEQGGTHVDSLIVANLDGTGEQPLMRKEGLAYLNNGPAWSPDGKTIVCGAGVGPDFLSESVVAVPVEGEKERWITSHRWNHVSSTVWLGDGSGLIVIARVNTTAELQLWHISYPGGEVQRVTNDLSGYLEDSLSITADSSALVAAQEDTSSRIWVSKMGEGEDRARQITSGKFDGLNGVAWTPDGKVLCVLKTGDDTEIWLMNRDGTERKQLTADAFAKGPPEMSPDGRHIVFTSLHGGASNIWRMDADGSNQKQLTTGVDGDFGPKFTPDGQWVLFWSWRGSGSGMIMKVSIDGSEPVQLTEYTSLWPTISPDGKLIAFSYRDEKQSIGWYFAIIPSTGGQPIKLRNLPSSMFPSVGLGWTPDSSELVYAAKHNGVSNVWAQPINGDPPKQFTNFKSDLIFRFALSRDGRQLVLARGTQTRDVVLIKDFR